MNQAKVLQIISAVGVVLFALVLLVSLLFAKQLEQSALGFIKQKATAHVHRQVDRVTGIHADEPNIAQRLFLKKYRTEMPQLKADLESVVAAIADGQFADQVMDSQQIDRLIQAHQHLSKFWQYQRIKQAFGKLSDLVGEQYQATWQALNQDVRLFALINAGSFMLVFLLCALIKPMPRYVQLVSWLLAFCTVVSILIYIFGQNWFYSILFNRYYGTGYFTLLGLMFLYLLFEVTVAFVFDRESKHRSRRLRRRNRGQIDPDKQS